MPSGKVKAIVGAAAAVAAAGGLGVMLVKHAPKRRAYREATGWTPAVPKGMSMSVNAAEPYSPPDPKAKPIETADPKPKPGFIGALKEIYYEFSNDNVMTQAAALAFYSGLAFAPLLTVAVWVMRVFVGDRGKDNVGDAIGQVMGGPAGDAMKQLLDTTGGKAESGMTLAGIVSIALVAFSASGVFGQVQAALNAIWHVEPKPSLGVMGFVRKRLLSLGMLASILFLLMTSLIVSVALQAFLGAFGGGAGTIVGVVANNLVSVALFTALFAALFRFVPDAKIAWKPVWIGALLSAVMFTAGKFGLAYYLGKSDYNSSYGAAVGSFVALLLWVYYSSVFLLVGAEATEVTARRMGHELEPDEHAVRVKQVKEG